MNYLDWNDRVEVGKHCDWLDEKPPLLKAGEKVQCPECGQVHDAVDLVELQWVFDLDDRQAYCKVISPPCHPDNSTVMPVIDGARVAVGTYDGYDVNYYANREGSATKMSDAG